MISVIRRYFRFCGAYRYTYYKGMIFGFLSAVGKALQFPAIFTVLNAAITGTLGTPQIVTGFLLMAASVILQTVSMNRLSMLNTKAGFGMAAQKRIDIADRLRRIPMGYLSGKSLGEITSVTTNTVDNLQEMGGVSILTVVNGFLSIFVYLIALLFYDWRMSLVVLVSVLLFLLINHLVQKRANVLMARKVSADERLVDAVLEYTQGIDTIRSFNLDREENGRLRKEIRENGRLNTQMENKMVPLLAVQSVLLKAGGVALCLLAFAMYLGGSLPLAQTLIMAVASFMVFGALEQAGGYASMLHAVSIALEKAMELEEIPVMDTDGESIQPSSHAVSFDHVSFGYGEQQVIHDVSFSLESGQTLALVGPSGSGKSTLCKLLDRFWDVDEGTIRLGGTDIRDYSFDSLMSQISMVFQDVYLFQDTVANNIRFGSPEATQQDVENAAKASCCHDFILQLPDGYQTVIGEGGDTLSGGQKQRLSIARAMLKDAPVVILDEATANVDPENEHELMRAIRALSKDKTLLVIAHRLKTIRHADQILVLDGGRVVQRGTHDELMAGDGIYRKFVSERKTAIGWKVK